MVAVVGAVSAVSIARGGSCASFGISLSPVAELIFFPCGLFVISFVLLWCPSSIFVLVSRSRVALSLCSAAL